MAKRVLNFSVVVDKSKEGFVVRTVMPKLFGETITGSELFEDFEAAAAYIETQLGELRERLKA